MSQKVKATKSKKEESSSKKSDGSQNNEKMLAPKPKSSSTGKSPRKRKSEGSAMEKSKAVSEASSSESSDVDAKKRKKQKKEDAVGGSLQDALKKSRLSAAASVSDFKFNKKRVRLVSVEENLKDDAEGIVYWMSRDQRVEDNWAFLYAQRLAVKQKLPLHVAFCLVPKFLEATIRHYGFMLKGLKEVAEVHL
ncbi:unnamed protein product [Staurois parvus]|uniref:Photolyase/cryptochrome alpha/beta domain-containing protein n=1 Tax=Staurois parvus TaxID=386267 RepID=A0ABN9BFQ2_9NEOB|nr:unnamed protein product [Staurois parvus]